MAANVLLLLVVFSCSVVSDSLWPSGLQHTRLSCPSLSLSLFKLRSTESVMPSNHLILCRPLLLMPSILPSIRVLLHIRWPKFRNFSFSISPSNEYSGLISFRIDWFDLLTVEGTLKSLLCMCLVTQPCLTLCNPMDYSLPGSSVHGDSPGKNTGWVAMPSSMHLPNPGIEPISPTLQADSLPSDQPGNNSRVFSNTMIRKHQFFSTQPSVWSNSHIWLPGYWKNHSFDYRTFVSSDVFLCFKICCVSLS